MVKSPTHSQFHEFSGDSRPAARSSRAAAGSERSTLERVISDLQRSGGADPWPAGGPRRMAGGVPSTLFVTRLAQLITIARRSPLGAYQYIVHLGLNGIVLLPLKLFSTGILELSFLKAVDDLLMRLGDAESTPITTTPMPPSPRAPRRA